MFVPILPRADGGGSPRRACWPDTDVLGGGARNAGFVVECDGDGHPLAMRVVKVRARVHIVAIVAAVCLVLTYTVLAKRD